MLSHYASRHGVCLCRLIPLPEIIWDNPKKSKDNKDIHEALSIDAEVRIKISKVRTPTLRADCVQQLAERPLHYLLVLACMLASRSCPLCRSIQVSTAQHGTIQSTCPSIGTA